MGSESTLAEGTGNSTAMDSAEKRLNELGYKQELRREMVILDLDFVRINQLFLVINSVKLFYLSCRLCSKLWQYHSQQ